MHPHQSLALTALTSALVANAFLLPSSLSWGPASNHGASSLDYGSHLVASSTTKSRTVRLTCPGCSFPRAYGREEEASDEHHDVTENSLILTFNVSDDGRTLLLNNEPLYPLRASLSEHSSLYAHQVPSTVSLKDLASAANAADLLSRPRQLFYTEAGRTTEAADGSEASIADIDLQINSIDSEVVNVDRLAIRVLGDEEGRLNIVDIINVPLDHTKPAYDSADPSSHVDDHDGYELVCEGPLAAICRLRAFMEDRFSAMRNRVMKGGLPCPGAMRHGHGPMHHSHEHHMEEMENIEGGAFQHHGHHIPFRGGADKFKPYFPDANSASTINSDSNNQWSTHAHRDWRIRMFHVLHVVGRSMHRLFVGFFIPVLIGIAAGMVASVLGMCVGTMVAWAWIKFVRGGKRGNASRRHRRIVLEEENREQSEAGEKVALMANERGEEEAPPIYVEKE